MKSSTLERPIEPIEDSVSTGAEPQRQPPRRLLGRLGVTAPLALLGLLAAAHFLVDIVAGTMNPLWPALEQQLSLRRGGMLWGYVAWSLATSLAQLVFGLWADRRGCRWLIWFGPLVAIFCVSCVGWAGSPWSLGLLLVVGGLGIAAFHPEAAAMSGSLMPGNRSRAMAIFALCGYLGQAAGPYYSGLVSDTLGLRGLTLGILWGLPLLLILWAGLRGAGSPVIAPRRGGVCGAAAFPLGVVSLLLAVGSLRMLPALGVPLALAYLLDAGSASGAVIGAVQSAFMAGIGIGAMACAALLRPAWERTTLWLMPLAVAPLLAILGWTSGWTLVGLVGTCGMLLGVTMPVYISYGQQLIPDGQRVASSITMGVSWGISSGGVALAMWVYQAFDALPSIFLFFAAASAASSLLCLGLPPIRPATDSPVGDRSPQGLVRKSTSNLFPDES